MSNLRTVCRPHTVLSSFGCFGRNPVFQNPDCWRRLSSPSIFSPSFGSSRDLKKTDLRFRVNQRRTVVNAANWTDPKSPYETLGFLNCMM
ncbi:hypothetical protein SLEP1_g2079 [Rubroshorea leprosula]|uniref:Uncharacterized protein n=1 Tax=Rubroshorea leprosula TaxID=152421 RepID=A0AAV5HMJ4_9ROSI|nr:hypothetical protein SLEP1_g2079 [Rubroshorea leprosula]